MERAPPQTRRDSYPPCAWIHCRRIAKLISKKESKRLKSLPPSTRTRTHARIILILLMHCGQTKIPLACSTFHRVSGALLSILLYLILACFILFCFVLFCYILFCFILFYFIFFYFREITQLAHRIHTPMSFRLCVAAHGTARDGQHQNIVVVRAWLLILISKLKCVRVCASLCPHTRELKSRR